MCWKHEWARAINNLEWAKIHIQRAKVKVQNRNLVTAAEVCERLAENLEELQGELKNLIRLYGISKKQGAESLEKHMRGRRVKSGKVMAWVKAN